MTPATSVTGLGWVVSADREQVHVMPVGDLRLHERSVKCWCQPRQDPEDEALWSHNSMDRREHTTEKGKLQ